MTTHLQQRARTIRVLSIASVLVISGIAVSQASYSAFSATTSNSGNSWSSGEATFTNDRATTPFVATNLDSLDSGSIPVILTYTGANDPNAYVTLTAKADGTDVALADKIDITLYASDNGTADGNHTAEANVMWSGTLGQLLTLNPSAPNGAVVQHTSDFAGTKTWIDWQVSGDIDNSLLAKSLKADLVFTINSSTE